MRQHAERSGDYAPIPDSWSDLVYRFPFLDDLPRRRAFAGREDWAETQPHFTADR